MSSSDQQTQFKDYLKILAEKEILNFKATSNHVIIKYIHTSVREYREMMKEDPDQLEEVMEKLCQDFLRMRHMTQFVLELMQETIEFSK